MAIISFGMWAEKTHWGQKLGGPLILLATSMLAANSGLIPFSAPVYDVIASLLVPMAIPLLLLRADFRSIFVESGSMLLAFIIAAAATAIGALVAASVLDLGQQEAQITGTIASSYIGGSLNFVATAEAVGIKDSSLYVAGLSADAAGAVFFLVLLMLLPTFQYIRTALPSKYIDINGGKALPATLSESDNDTNADTIPDTIPDTSTGSEPFQLTRIANGLTVSLVICALAAAITSLLDIGALYILVVTALTLVVANFAKPIVRQVSSEFEIGSLFMYIFFVVIGAGANLSQVVGAALPIALLIVVMVLVHFCILLFVGKLMKLDLAEVIIASNACILGPAPAAALAASKGWQALVAPGILVGLFGYAIATFIGVAIASILAL
ncbi:DUF819 family protein [Microbulbifer bruguierae]|uniref:DUF819 family protein n=1 Tax=Microbulbifer bruguierae TaxID=3029061 RepID=A0ABY8NG29_9GAMM|nr:DUF819 family protein [Microbulbifer bruguierae]WGL17891.1 DUF819 family protein [Microbulbifer bruguierae]